jgi:hypothetical protein
VDEPLNREELRLLAWKVLQRLDEELRPPGSPNTEERAAEIAESVARSEEWLDENDCIDLIIRPVIAEMGVTTQDQLLERDVEFWDSVMPSARALLAARKGGSARSG